MSKTYTKIHKSKKAAQDHVKNILNRDGAKVKVKNVNSGTKITYYWGSKLSGFKTKFKKLFKRK